MIPSHQTANDDQIRAKRITLIAAKALENGGVIGIFMIRKSTYRRRSERHAEWIVRQTANRALGPTNL